MTVLKQGAEMAQYGWLMGVMTLVFMSIMVGWIAYLWAPSQNEKMQRIANLPLEE